MTPKVKDAAAESPLASGSTVGASRSQGAPFGKAGRLSLRLAVALAALLFLAPLATGEASASCGSSHRLQHGDSDCLHGWWDNSPPASSGVALGTKYGAQSFCSHYGTVVAKIDISAASDVTWHLNSGSKRRGQKGWGEVRSINCCADISDICIKGQVEAASGHIRHYNSSSTSWDLVDVSTHLKRYDHCQDHSSSIYCEVDPEGDAHVPPNCDDHECALADCNSNWNQSDASDDCELESMTFDDSDYSNPTCRVAAHCDWLSDRTRYTIKTVKVSETDDLKSCNGLLKLSC